MNKFLLLLFIAISTNVFGYNLPSQKSFKANDSKNLIVVLFNTDDSMYLELDTDFADEYQRSQKLYNEKVQELFPTMWTATSGEIKFLTNEQVSKLDQTEAKESLFLMSGFKLYRDAIGSKTLNYYNWKIFSPKEEKKIKTYFNVNFQVNQLVDEADILFYIQQANRLVDLARNGVKDLKSTFDFDKTMSILNKKTVLVDEQMTDKTANELTVKYAGKVKISSRDVINEAILNKDENVLFVKLLFAPNNNGNHIYGVFEAETGNLIAISAIGGVTIKIGAGTIKRNYNQNYSTQYYSYSNRLNMASRMDQKYTIFTSSVGLKAIHFKIFQKKSQKMNYGYF